MIENNRTCRFCNAPLNHTVVDLGMQPLCEDFVKQEQINKMEPHYPLHVYVCEKCFLVQLEEFVQPSEIYDDYFYFSSYSDYWLEHVKKYTGLMIDRFNLNEQSFVAELASNDGYLLQYFKEKNIPVLGIDPAVNAAKIAINEKGINTEMLFFGVETAKKLKQKYGRADLIIGNNVLAHVPDINDFVSGMKIFLKSDGVITMEFPHLQRLMEENQFDTIYHEHFSYLSFFVTNEIFKRNGLTLWDVDELPTHGGSLRIYGKHSEDNSKPISVNVHNLLKREKEIGYDNLEYYNGFKIKVNQTKRKILEFFIQAKNQNKQIVGYGAPGKGNTLLNFCGIRTDFLDYTVDRNPAKHGLFLPGTLIPIFDTNKLKETKPDYVFILPWNLKDEIMKHHNYIKDWGGKFVIPIPELKVFD
jgi:SAM-dependent methyltransferase